MSYHKCHCWWSVKHARPSFGQEVIRNGKETPVRDLCGGEPDYVMPERDNSYVSYLSDLVSTFAGVWVSTTLQICSLRLNWPKNENEKNERKRESKPRKKIFSS